MIVCPAPVVDDMRHKQCTALVMRYFAQGKQLSDSFRYLNVKDFMQACLRLCSNWKRFMAASAVVNQDPLSYFVPEYNPQSEYYLNYRIIL